MKGIDIIYTSHAVKQMFQRNISVIEVETILQIGEIIMEYQEDKPFPSKLQLATINLRPLHLVSSFDFEEQKTIIITVYEPSLERWEKDFKTRKK